MGSKRFYNLCRHDLHLIISIHGIILIKKHYNQNHSGCPVLAFLYAANGFIPLIQHVAFKTKATDNGFDSKLILKTHSKANINLKHHRHPQYPIDWGPYTNG